MSNPHTLAVETDTQQADLWAEAYRLRGRLGLIAGDLHRHAGHYRQFVSRNRSRWTVGRNDFSTATLDMALARIAERLPSMMAWDQQAAQRSLDAKAETETQLDATFAKINELEKIWAANGRWNRFFLVTSSAGHIHSGMNCSTCRPTTEFAWLPTVSGLTEVEAVAEHGPTLCSVCFPSAPVEWTLTVGQAKKLAKAPSA